MLNKIYVFTIAILLSLSCVAEEAVFELKDFSGNPTKLESRAGGGKWLVVMIWATDCSVCFKEMPHMKAFHAQHKAHDATVLGVALDGYAAAEAVKSFAAEQALNFPNLIAEMPAFGLRYEFELGERLLGTPTYLLFSPDGDLVANNPGPLRTSALEKFMRRKSQTQ